MALKGNLRDFTITQILNLINLAQKSGSLVIEGPSQAATIYFREGKLAYAQFGQDDNSLAAILYRANKITSAQHRAIKTRAAHMSDKELGLLLINANYMSRQDILNSLQSHFLNVLNHIFTWVEGLFRFDTETLPPNGKITVRISLENIIIEGSRRFREWEQLQDEIPSLDMALKFVDRPGSNLRNVNLSVEEWRVASFINPKNTMRQIARATKMNDLEIRRIVYGMLQAGLVEIIRPEGMTPIRSFTQRVVEESRKPAAVEEHRSLVNRIIGRIRSL